MKKIMLGVFALAFAFSVQAPAFAQQKKKPAVVKMQASGEARRGSCHDQVRACGGFRRQAWSQAVLRCLAGQRVC